MRRIGTILVILMLVACGVGGLYLKGLQSAQKAAQDKLADTTKVSRTDLDVRVIESGSIDAVKSVEVKSRVSGRLARLFVEEGDRVTAGQLIAQVDRQEPELRVRQDSAQLRGAQSNVGRIGVEIAQRRVTAKAQLDQAILRARQLETEMQVQPSLTRSQVAAAEATLSAAKEELERLRTSGHPNQRTALEAAVREASATLENAEREYNRNADLERRGFVAKQVVEQTKLAMDLAKVRLDSAKANLSRLDSQQRSERASAEDNVRRAQADRDRVVAGSFIDVNKRREYQDAVADISKARAALKDIDVLMAQRSQGQASVDQLNSVLSDSMRQLRETNITAPLSGVVSKKYIQIGELATGLSAFSQGTPIVRIEDRSVLRVNLNVNEIDVAKLSLGMSASVEVDALPGKKYSGLVKKIAPASLSTGATTTTSTSSDTVVKYAVEIWLDSPDDKLRSGMSAKCTLQVAGRKNVLALPVEFIGKDKQGSFVDVVVGKTEKGHKTETRRVTTGLTTGSQVEILTGIKEGETVARPKFSGPPRQGFIQTN